MLGVHRQCGAGEDPARELSNESPIQKVAWNDGWRAVSARDEVIVRSSNFLICKAAFEKALFVYPKDHLEMRQGARILLKSKEDEPGS